jgi:hypothetical protein
MIQGLIFNLQSPDRLYTGSFRADTQATVDEASPRAILPAMRRGLLALCFATIAAVSIADKWCFVVAGDGRSNDVNPDMSGMNSPVVAKLFQAIKAENPKFMLWTGDLVHGEYGKITTPIAQQLAHWKQSASVLTGVGILPVRGNHETVGDPKGSIWQKSIKPLIDANHVSYFKGETGYSYTFTPKQDPKLTVIALDQYVHAHRVNLTELEAALQRAKDSGVKNVVVFAHEMAFTCTAHGDDDNLSKFTADRDKFLELLEMYGVRYFFAGHDHCYDWMEIRHKKWPQGYTLNQIVAGTAGAPFYKDQGYFGDHGSYDLTRKEHRDGTYGYMLVELDDNEKMTVTFKEIKP